jgi:hypothetical protein
VPGTLCKVLPTAAEVRRPKEKPIEKKKAQTSTRAKKIASMRPVPRVISVSFCVLGIEN